jgi:hypothetical protein
MALLRWSIEGRGLSRLTVGVRSDRFGEFIESCRQSKPHMTGFDAEFVVAAPQVLDECVTAITVDAVRAVRRPRIGRSLALSRP